MPPVSLRFLEFDRISVRKSVDVGPLPAPGVGLGDFEQLARGGDVVVAPFLAGDFDGAAVLDPLDPVSLNLGGGPKAIGLTSGRLRVGADLDGL